MNEIIKAIIDKIPRDRKSRIKLIITAILIIIFIFSWANTIKVLQKRWGGAKKKEVSSKLLVATQAPKVEEIPLVQVIYEDDDGLEWIRCPFCGKLYIDGGGGVVVLSGILWDVKDPKAVINGEIVGIGDKVNKYSVIDIDRNIVILNDGSKDIEISLEE